jgi:hypothetical protein
MRTHSQAEKQHLIWARQRLAGIARARKLLGDARLTAFLRWTQRAGQPLACELINEELDEGSGLAALDGDGGFRGYHLKARRISGNEYRIEFGASVAEDAGDGGEWVVTFRGDEVDKAEPAGIIWMR